MIEEVVESVDDTHRHLAAEVLELGQALFDELIAFAEARQAPEDGDAVFPVEEVRAAAGEFFRALRVMLDVDPPATVGDRRQEQRLC